MSEQTIFLAALEFTDLAARMAYLDQACAGDLELRRQVEALLAAHDRTGEFLDVPAIEQVAARSADFADGSVTVAESSEAGAGRASPVTRGEKEWTQQEEGDGEAAFLALLQPPGKPGSLGRLGHYEVLEILGRGGFGIVVKAFDDVLHRMVAIKVMSAQLAGTSPPRKRFLREARSAAAIRHENVVIIHAVEEQPIPYLVMEYIAGETLQQKLDRVGPLDVPEVLRLGRQIADGLAAAHALGLIHRDIKPSNILLETGVQERAKITDFGLARAADDASLTQSGFIAGTPMYMAPEQAQGEVLDHRADLFSLGSVLYVMCSGRPPFRAANMVAVLKRVAEDKPRPIQEIIPEVPEWLCAIVARLHAKQPADRFQTAKEVADLLATCLAELQRNGDAPAIARAVPPLSAAHAPFQRPTAKHVAGRLLVGGLFLAAMLTFAGLLFAVWSRSQPDPKAPIAFRVEANKTWQDTGMDVVEGEPVILAPTGTWRKGQQACQAGGLEEASRDDAVLPDAPFLCLLARVGDDPTPMPVLQRQVFKPRRSGRLFVQANDLELDGNGDGIQLTIAGGLRVGDAAPAPALLPGQIAAREWKPFLNRVEAPGAKAEQVREAVFEYCLKYPGTPQAVRAGQMLLKSPPLVNSIGMKLVPIPPGTFLMGSPDNEADREVNEGPQHEVVITRPFYIGGYDVTVAQFRDFVTDKKHQTDAERGTGGWRFLPDGSFKPDPKINWQDPGFKQTNDHPVVCVSWNDAQAFCGWLSEKEGMKYALPTEAQWEYCCRAGSRTMYYFGSNDAELTDHAWYATNSGNHTHPVGQKKPNAWGLYDMHGNVEQWVADRYAADYYRTGPKEDPPGPSTGGSRVIRGGFSYVNCTSTWCRDAHRYGRWVPYQGGTIVGFRVVVLR